MKTINIDTFIKMLDGGNQALNVSYKYINDLNVFPVPDGDTGINMKMTSDGGYNLLINNTFKDFKQLSALYSKNLLFSARGNSGVIFSQIMKGFCSDFKDNQTELGIQDLIDAFNNAKNYAYKAVHKPIEGTILTLIRVISEKIPEHQYETINQLFAKVIEIGSEVLLQTKEILPELKSANVVDSGAYALLCFLKGMNAVINDDIVKYIDNLGMNLNIENTNYNDYLSELNHHVEYGYCTEVIINLYSSINPQNKEIKKRFIKAKFDHEVNKFGTSTVTVVDNNYLKVHTHTTKPYLLLQLGQKYGEFDKIKIENMTNQFLERVSSDNYISNNLNDELAIVFTCDTNEMSKFIYEIVENSYACITELNTPSVKDFIPIIKQTNSKNILLLIDNPNYMMTVNELIKYFDNKINIAVVNTKSFINTLILIPEIEFDTFNPKRIQEKLNKIVNNIPYAMITTAIKDDPDNNIAMNDCFSISDKKVLCSNKNSFDTLLETFKILYNKNHEQTTMCLLICGINSNNKIIDKFTKYLEETYGILVDIKKGNQSVYNYYMGLM